ncbi:unnamed protein product [Gongylonema pulchrum]|uniref:STI1 domain-containing protein n=1 Tax=Gongylonema pulchrum TaxID=637853 RepID=A0A183ER05_9BILA|nr:unnamed protein product [Gongylonema pulchrum]
MKLFKAKKIIEHNRNKERRKEEKESKERRERVRQAQEARKQAEEEAKKDPEVMSLLQDETVLKAYMDITQNPANISKHLSNPKVMKLFSKIGSAAGGFGMGTGNAQGGSSEQQQKANDGGAATTDMPPPPKKAPEPDLD